MAKHNEIGKIGEVIAADFLIKNGYTILGKNFSCHYGEIDIIAMKKNVLHFVEVKSVEVSDFKLIDKLSIDPSENLTFAKWNKIVATINCYFYQKGLKEEDESYVIDLACVYINTKVRQGKIVFRENIHKE